MYWKLLGSTIIGLPFIQPFLYRDKTYFNSMPSIIHTIILMDLWEAMLAFADEGLKLT